MCTKRPHLRYIDSPAQALLLACRPLHPSSIRGQPHARCVSHRIHKCVPPTLARATGAAGDAAVVAFVFVCQVVEEPLRVVIHLAAIVDATAAITHNSRSA